MQQCQIQFQGFHPSSFTKTHIEEICWDILDEAPRGAVLNAVVRRKDHEYSTHITIHSNAGRFFGLARDPKLFQAVRKVFSQVDKQICKWQARRHDRSSIRGLRLVETEMA